MRIEINIEKKYFLTLFTLFVLLIGVVGSVAYTSNFPATKKNVVAAQNFGHTADEVVVASQDTNADGINDGGLITLQDWIDSDRTPSISCGEVAGTSLGISGNNVKTTDLDAVDKTGQEWCAQEFPGSSCTGTTDASGDGNQVGTCHGRASQFSNDDVIYCCKIGDLQ